MPGNVDTRVLEMEFDNKNFEKNVSTSLTTLDKLKKALNLDGASKGLETVDTAANKLNFDKLVSAATALEKRFSVFGEIGVVAIQRVANAMLDLSTKTVSFLSSGIVQGGLKRAMNLEQADFQLQGLLKDTKAVAAIMEDVSWSVDGTAYGLDAAAKAASMFAATGMRAGDQMKGALRGVAGVAAMTNSEYEDIARIFTTVAGQGKVMADQYNQLASRGLNAAAVVADYLTKVGDGAKVTEAQVREMTSHGEISFATFAAAMDDAFGEHAKAANKTFNGAMSNIRAALARIGADFVSPIIKQDRELVWLLNHIRLKINDIRKQTSPFAAETAAWLNNILYKAALFVKSLDFSYNSMSVRIVKTNWESFLNVVTAVKQVFLAIGAGFKEVFPESASGTLLEISQKIRGLTERLIPSTKAFQNIRDTSKAFFTILRDGAEVVSMVADKIWSLLSAGFEKLNINISDIPGNVSRAILAFKEIGDGANIFLIPIGALYTAFEIGIRKIKEWVDAFKQIPQVQKILERLNQAITPFVDFFKDFGTNAKASIDQFIQSIREMDGVSFDSLADLLESLRDILSGGFENIWDNLKNFPNLLGKMRDAISEQLSNIGTVFSSFWEGVKKSFGSIANFFTDEKTIAGIISAIFGFGLFELLKNIRTNILPLFTSIPRLIDSATGLIGQLKKSVKQVTTGIMFDKVAKGVYTIAKAIAVLVAALVVLSQVPVEQLQTGGIALTMIAGGLAALVAAFAKLDSGGKVDIKGVGTTMVAMAAAIFVLSGAIKSIADMDPAGLLQGMAVITLLIIEMTAAATIIGKNQGVLEKGQKQMTSSVSMISFAFSIRTLVGVLKTISEMNPAKLFESMVALTILMAEMVAMTKLTSGGGWESGVGMLALAVSIQIMVKALEKIGDMDMAKLAKAEMVLISITAIIALMSVALNAGGSSANAAQSGLGLFGAAAAMLIIGFAIEKLGGLDVATIAKGLAVVTTLGLVFVAIIAATKLAGDNAMKVSVTLIAMSAAIAILAGIITLLGSLDEKTVIQGTAVVSILMAMFALIIASTKLANDSKATLIIVTMAVTMLAAAIGLLSFIEPDRLYAASTALSMVMAMFAVMVASTGLAKQASASVAIMGLVVAELAGVLIGMSYFDTEKMIPAAEALSLLMLALSAAFVIISNCKDPGMEAVIALGFMGVVVAELAVVLGTLAALNIEPSIETAASLSLLLVAMSGCLAILSVMHVDVGTATNAALALSAFIGILGGVMLAIGALMEYVPELETFLDKGIEVLVKIGQGLGRFAGAIIEGFINQVANSLPNLGMKLSLFMINAMPFLAGARTIDQSVVNGVVHLAGAIIAISAAQVIQGITDLLPFTGSIEDFGATLVTLGKAMVKYSSVVAGKIDAEAVVASATAAEALAVLQQHLPRTGGVWQEWFGEKMDLDAFGQNMEKFGYSLVRYSNAITKDGGVDSEAIEASARAASALTELQNNLPSTGGILQEWLGEKMDLDAFGQKMEQFGYSLVRYSNAITSDGGLDAKAITDSAKAGQLLADLQASLPTVDGKIQEWFGQTMDLKTFGDKLVGFAKALVDYCSALGKGDGINTSLIEQSAKAASKLVDLQNALPDENGWFQNFFGGGTMDIAAWGQKLADFGNSLSHYSAILAIGKGVDIDLIQESVDAANILVGLQESIPDDKWGQGTLVEFGNKLREFGYAFSAATEEITNVDHVKLRLAIEDLQSLIGLCMSMTLVNKNSLIDLSNGLRELASKGISAFVDKFNNSGAAVDAAIKLFVDRVVASINKNQNRVNTAMDDLVGSSLQQLDSRKSDFGDTGSNLLQQMITGFEKEKTHANETQKGILDFCLKTINGTYFNKFKTAGIGLLKETTKGTQEQKTPFTTGIKEIMDSGKNAINNESGEYKSAAENVMVGFVATIDAAKPKTESSVTSIMNGVIDRISSKKDEIKNAGSVTMTSLSAGISNNWAPVSNAASDVVDKAYNTIRAYGDKNNKFYNVGAYYASGMAKGMDDYAYKALASAKYLAQNMDQMVRNTLKIKSPSRVAYETGGYYGEGFVNAILDTVHQAYKAAKEMATGANDGLNDALHSAISLVSESFDLTPVITPEIDASRALATASQINSLFSGGRDFRLGSAIRNSNDYQNQNGKSESVSEPAATATYQFTQNNYSPKALSRIDIYRQTKNQFTTFKEATVRK